MGTVLGILAIGILLALAVISMSISRRARASEHEQEANRMQIGKEQHESSLRRRAEVRAAPPAEPAVTDD